MAIEFDAGKKEAYLFENERNRIIIGQIVCWSQSNDTLYRRFFSFRAAAGLGMQTLLVGDKEIAPLENLLDTAQCKEWLKTMRGRAPKEHPASFYDTDKQYEWRQHLAGTWGIDQTLVELQWRYNKREGGVEVRDANSFTDYQDFMRKFMGMCLTESSTSALKNNIESNIKNLSDVPRFEEQLAVFRSLQENFEPFRLAAQNLREAVLARNNELRAARGLALALERQADMLQQQRATHRENALTQEKRIATAEAGRQEAEARQRGLEMARHKARMRDSHAVYNAALEKTRLAWGTLQMRKARKALIDIDADQAEIVEKERQLKLANAEIEELQTQAQEAGGRYRSALNKSRKRLNAAKKRKESVAACLGKAKSALLVRETSLGKEKDALTKAAARIQAKLEQAAISFTRLAGDGCIHQEEDGRSAQRRLLNEQGTLKDTLCSASAAITNTTDRIANMRQEIAEKDKERASLLQQADELGREYNKGRNLAGELLKQLYESALVDTPEANLESPIVQRNLDERRERLEDEITALVMKKSTLENGRDSVERFAVLGVDHNVAAVLRALLDKKVQALPYGAYLSDILGNNPEEARSVFLSDPARFSGIQVLDQAALEAAKSLTELSLDRPVVVSLATGNPVAPDSDTVIVGHEGHGLYNKPAAKAFAERWNEQLAALERSHVTVRQKARKVADWLARLAAYIQEYGSGRLKAIRSSEEQFLGQAQSLVQWLQEAGHALTEQEGLLSEQQASHTGLSSQLNALDARLRRVEEYVKDFETHKLSWEREQEALDRQLAVVNERLQRHLRHCARGDVALSRFNRETDKLENEVINIERLLSEVTLYSDEWLDIDADYEPLGRIYATVHEALKDKQDGKARDLSEALHILRTGQHKKIKAYKDNYGKYKEADIRAIATEGLNAKIDMAEGNWLLADKTDSAAKSALDEATGVYRHDMDRWHKEGLAIIDAGLDDSIDLAALDMLLQEVKEEIAIAGKVIEEALHEKENQEALAAEAAEDRLCYMEAKSLVETACAQLADIRDMPAADVAVPTLDMALVAAQSQQKRLQDHISAVHKFDAQAHKLHSSLMRRLESEEVRKAAAYESALMLQAGRADYEAFVADADEKSRIITDRIKMLEDNIAKSEEGLQACARALSVGVETGLRLLRYAAQFMVPEAVPFIGGERVLKIGGLDKLFKAKDSLEEHLKPFIKRLVADAVSIPGGDLLVANALCHVAERQDIKLNVRILKPVPALGRCEHVDIRSYSSSSGGEGLTSALMYYLLAAHIRSKEQGRDGNFGGALILDNPVGEANLAMLLQAQRDIAGSLGIQLIYYTGIKDMESMSEFNHHVTLRASRKEDRQSGRRYMEVWATEVQSGAGRAQAASP